jgi:glycosyltransferase involved in cell wall biosynthesis
LAATEKHIVFITSGLSVYGGLERVLANTVNLIAQNGNKISLIILAENNHSVFPIDTSINIVNTKLSFGIGIPGNPLNRKITLLKDIKKLRTILNTLQPTIVIANEYPFSIAAAITNKKKNYKAYSWEHSHFSTHKKNWFWTKMMSWYYPKLDGIICLNPDEQKLYLPFNKKTIIIPNFVNVNSEKTTTPKKQLLTIGRLTEAKGITELLPVANSILNKYPDWKWLIIGTGELEQQILEFIEDNNLAGKLILQKPLSDNINNDYQASSIYVMTSKHERFGMVLAEAMSNGVPCISFDCDTGPRHIITNNEDGLLIEKENPKKLAAAISLLIENEGVRKNMGKKAIANVQRFSPEKIYELWMELLDN